VGSPFGSAAHVFVDSLGPSSLQVGDDDRHHLDRVLRLRPGEEVTASDGRGHWCRCRYAGSGRLEVEGPVEFVEAGSPAITIGFALTKGDRPEWVVQKLTEVGVDHIAPFVGSRSVVRWDQERGDRHVERLRAIARGAAMQSRRVWLPTVGDVSSFVPLAAGLGAKGALAHPGGGGVSLARPAVLIGPEGGFTEAEAACGLPAVDLGPSVLRAETAALAAGILLCALRVGLVSQRS
jgi:16S rRNA (uracil1498-N3)-methyltransferase